jgi:hypothetical protein
VQLIPRYAGVPLMYHLAGSSPRTRRCSYDNSSRASGSPSRLVGYGSDAIKTKLVVFLTGGVVVLGAVTANCSE